MPIKNYTTKVSEARTAGEIAELLVGFGARSIQHEFGPGGEMTALSFSIQVDGSDLYYRLPTRPEGVLATLERDGAQKQFCTLEHARKVSWRIVKDWVAAQLALVDSGTSTAPEVFLPYMLVSRDQTVFDAIQGRWGFENLPLQLTAGEVA